MVYEESNGHVTDDVRDPERSSRYPNMLSPLSRKQLEMPFGNNRHNY